MNSDVATPMADRLERQAPLTTAIILVTYNFAPWFYEFFRRIEPILAEREDVELLIVENASRDTTRELLASHLFGGVPVSAGEWRISTAFPNIELYLSSENSFFAGGNNIGIRHAMEHDARYVFLLNQDAFLRPGGLEKIERFLDEHPASASVQPIIMIEGTDRINSAGVSLNFLQIGSCRDFNRPYDSKRYHAGEQINYAMGAGCMFRVSALRETGLFPEEYQMYHEDSFLQLRMKYLGYTVNLINEPLVDHDYSFASAGSFKKFFYIERNRLWNILVFYKWKTIAALLPIMLLVEFGMVAHAFSSGWGRLKLKSWLEVIAGLGGILGHRHHVQTTRKISDRRMLQELASSVDFDEVNGPALDLMNLLLRGYFRFLMLVVRW